MCLISRALIFQLIFLMYKFNIEHMEREDQIKALDTAINLLQEMKKKLMIEKQLEEWYQEEEELRKEIPDFDLKKEVNDEKTGKIFAGKLGMGWSVKEAYDKVHREKKGRERQ